MHVQDAIHTLHRAAGSYRVRSFLDLMHAEARRSLKNTTENHRHGCRHRTTGAATGTQTVRMLIGRAAIGRATVEVLQINRPNLVALRELLMEDGLF